ncbi:MAG: thioredoxin domain-containing protein [Cyanobacteria bacterium J06641_5]
MRIRTVLLLSALLGSTTLACAPTPTEPTATQEAPAVDSDTVLAEAPAAQGTVGGPLADSLQGKPVVVDVFATWCAGCKNIEGTLSQLREDYGDKVNFVVLDVSDKAKVDETEALASELGLSDFLAEKKSKTSTVAIVDPATGDILAIYKNNPNIEDYTQVLNAAIAQN